MMNLMSRSGWEVKASRLARVAVVSGVALASLAICHRLPAEETSGRAIVTASAKAKEDAPTIPRNSISVAENRKMVDVTGWTALRGERAGLQLVILLDDSSRGNIGSQLNDLRTFVTALPPSTAVAIGYMRNGTPNLSGGFTTDHTQAAKVFRLPVGSPGINGSPYFCLSDLVKHWPGGDANVRREVIMITDGTDRYSGGRFDPDNPYVRSAMSDAQKAGVIVYSIYYRGAGRLDDSRQITDGGQNYLTQLSDATGGQVYLEGFGNPVSFSSFLSDIQKKLQNQYELSFASSSKPGLQPIKVKTTQPNTSLKWPASVQVGSATAP